MSAKLYRRPGSLVWWFTATDENGRTSEHSTGHVNLDAATAYADEHVAPAAPPSSAAPHGPKTPAPYSVNDALADFLSFGELDRSADTIDCYESKGGHLVRLLGEYAIDSLHVDDVHLYCKTRLAEGAARESVRKELCVLRQSLRMARDRGRFARDPGGVIPRFRAKYTPRRRYLTELEFAQLLRQLPQDRQLWVMLAVCCGGRLSELEALQWGDIDWKASRIHVRGTKSKNADRFVPLHGPLAVALSPLRGPDSEPVVGRWHNVRRDLTRACTKAKIERVSPNDLRRTFASWLKQAECDSLAVAKLLGHSSSRMVEMVYGHLNQKALDQAVARLPVTNADVRAIRPVARRPRL